MVARGGFESRGESETPGLPSSIEGLLANFLAISTLEKANVSVQ